MPDALGRDAAGKIAGRVEVTGPEREFRARAGRRAHVLAAGEWLGLSA
ncbi:hypothetical protein ACFORO_19930 [Amycolatopsis halotolerans]|uniref:Uncharacterized protein n=1 Tax=Amycolatopsis halotolerans TaxID=330083 RepID=A0ABV7QKE2_9PSEU